MIAIHRCKTCGCLDLEHSQIGGKCSIGWCACTKSPHTVREETDPELIPSWNPDDTSQVNPHVLKPGTKLTPADGTSHTCACDKCLQLAKDAA